MATVFIPSQLQDLTGGEMQIEVEAATVRAAVTQLEEQFMGIRECLCDGDELTPALQVSIDNEISTRGLLAKLRPDSQVHFVAAIGGG